MYLRNVFSAINYVTLSWTICVKIPKSPDSFQNIINFEFEALVNLVRLIIDNFEFENNYQLHQFEYKTWLPKINMNSAPCISMVFPRINRPFKLCFDGNLRPLFT